MMPSLVVFCLAVVFNGNHEIAQAIDASWARLWPLIEPDKCCFDQPNAAIDALQWSPSKAASLTYSVLTAFSMGIYVPLAWVMTIAICFYFMTQLFEQGNNCDSMRMSTILVFQFAVISPLFVPGWDFGRWIFLWTASSLALFIFGFQTNEPLFKITNGFASRLMSLRLMKTKPNAWLLLIFGIPGCCWSVAYFIGSSPIGYYLVEAARFF